MTGLPDLPETAARPLRRALLLTRLGMVSERLVRGFWPAVAIVMAVLACLMFGLQDVLPLEAFWAGSVLAVLGLGWTLWRGVRGFRWPSRAEALGRLDATLPGRPIQAITDRQAIGAGDAASEAVWAAHVARMAERAGAARARAPDLKIARRDPFALRYVALVAFVMAVLFGSILRVASVSQMGPGVDAAAETAAWEGWVEPPAYTGKPSLYLADIPAGPLSVPKGSRLTLRLYGEVGQLIVDETVSGRVGEVEGASEPAQSFQVVRDGKLAIDGPGGREWAISVVDDKPPTIEPVGEATRTVKGEMRQDFHASDDYGVVAGHATIRLDMSRLDRRYGLAIDPEPRDPIEIDLPLPVTGDRSDFTETITEDFTQHPWAMLPVTITLYAEDAAGQEGASGPAEIILPGRRFFDVMAKALVENRRDILWNRANAPRVAQVLRAVSWHPDDAFRQPGVYLKLRTVIRRLESELEKGPLSDEVRDEIADVLWSLALEIEDGNLADALERLRQAQERLAEAIRNGATQDEIAKLMDELREAMDDYIAKLAEAAPEQGTDQPNPGDDPGNMMTANQLDEMLKQLQQLMEEGRTAEAQALLEQLNQLMENMQVTRAPGQGGPGQEAMKGLSETLREQQELSDDTFGDLQEQFGQGQQPGQQPGAEGRDGRQDGAQGQGRRGVRPGQRGQGQGVGPDEGEGGDGQGQGQGDGQEPGAGQGSGSGGTPDTRSPGEQLADRQDALRDLLREQERGMPGAGTVEGDAAREALDRAGEAMDRAEEALREGDLAGALDRQAEAMEALREGMRNLGEMMAQQQQPGQDGNGQNLGQNGQPPGLRDPLGRDPGNNGRVGTDEQLLQGEDVYRRAREILDELRRRSADQERPEAERDYLKRLLDRF
ncbi:DUF4175 domain-containing protein [Frigidibacter sp. ROC022]|uniref:DUF4175 domain-containing protein n=1 Tax=Frigidibacter sp. ROC022 TaxID=2971796 RepID=UPI00215AAF09|nr:DUF4175 domain-containing protein [Frigidibacter sp. ROC022]MCR8724897.1 DUF4175 domain-containing protein [Frigidibacter sp. ROC022]